MRRRELPGMLSWRSDSMCEKLQAGYNDRFLKRE
jgi:hypothetical protein